jgi:hypothetical protein
MPRLVAATLACAAIAVVAGCGSSSSSSTPTTPPISGTIMSTPFTPVEGAALVLKEASCTIDVGTGPIHPQTTGILVGLGSFTGVCSVAEQTKGCGGKASSTLVNLFVVNANIGTATPAPVAAGNYTVTAPNQVPPVDSQGNVTYVSAIASRTDATCGEPTPPVTATSGTIRLDVVSASQVAGEANLTFADGSTLSGAFTVTPCTFQTDACTLLAGQTCSAPVCVP